MSSKRVDRLFGCLLLIASVLHCAGSFIGYKSKPELLLWSEGTGLAGLLLAGLNILRVERPFDRPLGWVSFAGCLGWLTVVVAFGKLIGNIFDFRSLTQGIITLVLTGMSLRTALGKAPVYPLREVRR